jgi:hypothetical protein
VKLHSVSRDISFAHRMASMPFIVSISQKYFAFYPSVKDRARPLARLPFCHISATLSGAQPSPYTQRSVLFVAVSKRHFKKFLLIIRQLRVFSMSKRSIIVCFRGIIMPEKAVIARF